MRRKFIPALTAGVLAGALFMPTLAADRTAAAATPSATADSVRPAHPQPHTGHVVLVAWDGFDPRYLSRVATPNLHALAAKGRLTTDLGTFPTISNPSWTSVATGAWPEVHGNAAYTFDRTAGVAVGQTRTMNAQSIAEDIGASGKTFASVNWYIVQNHGATYGDPKQLYVQASGGCAVRTDTALELLAGRPVNSGGTPVTVPEVPDMLAIYCDELDAIGHAEGSVSPNMAPALANLDVQLGRLVQALKDAGTYDDTTIILTGDHGMETFTHAFGQPVLDALTKAGYHPQFLTAGQKPAVGTDLVMVVGGAASVYLLGDKRTAHDIAAVATVLKHVKHVSVVHDRTALADRHASSLLGDLVAEPEVGWSFGVNPPSGGVAGYHGLSAVQHPAFMITGYGIRQNARLDNPRLIDIAPTIARLLDIPPPAQAQGRPLSEALAPGF